jgi:hypothetical protein
LRCRKTITSSPPAATWEGETAVSQYGKFLKDFATTDEALEFVKEHMERSQFWPTIFWISDHGNFWPIDTDGNEIHVTEEDDDHEHEWGPVESARFTGNPHRKCQHPGCTEITLDCEDEEDEDD